MVVKALIRAVVEGEGGLPDVGPLGSELGLLLGESDMEGLRISRFTHEGRGAATYVVTFEAEDEPDARGRIDEAIARSGVTVVSVELIAA